MELGLYLSDGSETDPTIKIELMKKNKVGGYVNRHTPDGKTESFHGRWTITDSQLRLSVGKKTCLFEYKKELNNGAGTDFGAGLVPIEKASTKDYILCQFSYINSKVK